jgi:hypothetical protein
MPGQHRSHQSCDFTWRLGRDEWSNVKNPHVKKGENQHTCSGKALGHSGQHKCKCGRKHGN